jgi:hypothetical protein
MTVLTLDSLFFIQWSIEKKRLSNLLLQIDDSVLLLPPYNQSLPTVWTIESFVQPTNVTPAVLLANISLDPPR